MTDMTVLDVPPSAPPPPPPKKTNWKVIAPVAIIVILCCICLVVAGIFAYMGTQGNGPLKMLATATSTPTSTPTRKPTAMPTPTTQSSDEGGLYLYFDWTCSDDYNGPLALYLYYDYTCEISDGTDSFYCTWWAEDNYLHFMFDDYPNAHYVGLLDESQEVLVGTMEDAEGNSGCWYATP